MAKKYIPRNNNLELEIKDELFSINAFEPTLLKRVEEHKKALNEKGLELETKRDDLDVKELEVMLENAISLCVDIIDDLLGENSVKRMFKEEPINFLDVVDISAFIFQEITEYIVVDVANKYAPNRADRRNK